MFKWLPPEWKMLLILLFLCIGGFLLSGCRGMSKKDVARQTRLCHVQTMNAFVIKKSGVPVAVECEPLKIPGMNFKIEPPPSYGK